MFPLLTGFRDVSLHIIYLILLTEGSEPRQTKVLVGKQNFRKI